MTTDREAFLASFKEYLATTPAVELLNDYTYLLIYINHDPYDEQERYQYLVDAVSTVGTKFSQVDTWRAGCAKRQREDDNAFWESAMAWHDHHYAKAPEPYCLSDVPCEETEWLVPDVLPRGEISLLGADGGTGKGIWQAQLIAYVTAGQTSGFFPEPPAQTGRVLILAGEDDPGKVLKGRITAAGADMSKVMVVSADDYYLRTGHQLCIGDDDITTFVAKINPILLILDPLQSFLPPDVEMASRNQMRGAVLPLKSLSTKYHLATLISMHTNKRPGVSGRGRLADSSDLWDIARSVLMMGRCKNSTEGPDLPQPREEQLLQARPDRADAHRGRDRGRRAHRAGHLRRLHRQEGRGLHGGAPPPPCPDQGRHHRRHPQCAGREPPWQHGQQRAARRRHQGGRVQREDLQPCLRGAGKERPHHEEGDPGERWLQPVVLLLRLE